MIDSCHKILGYLFLFVSTLFIIIHGINYLKYYSFEEGICHVTNVTYPESLLDTSNLISCNCGRSCTSDTGTCIKITGFLLKYPKIKNRHFVSSVSENNPRNDCTFAEKKCPDAEKISNRLQAIIIAKQKAQEYIEYQKNKTSIQCFYKNGEDYLYLNNKDQFILFYVTCGVWSLSIFCLCSCFFCDRESKERNSFV